MTAEWVVSVRSRWPVLHRPKPVSGGGTGPIDSVLLQISMSHVGICGCICGWCCHPLQNQGPGRTLVAGQVSVCRGAALPRSLASPRMWREAVGAVGAVACTCTETLNRNPNPMRTPRHVSRSWPLYREIREPSWTEVSQSTMWSQFREVALDLRMLRESWPVSVVTDMQVLNPEMRHLNP
jgi:hypothetical protein